MSVPSFGCPYTSRPTAWLESLVVLLMMTVCAPIGSFSQHCPETDIEANLAVLHHVYQGDIPYSALSSSSQAAYLDQLKELALFGDSSHLQGYSLFDQLIVLQARTHFSRQELEQKNGTAMLDGLTTKSLLFQISFEPKVRGIDTSDSDVWVEIGRRSKKRRRSILFYQHESACSADLSMYHQYLSDELQRTFPKESDSSQEELIHFIERLNGKPFAQESWRPIIRRLNPYRAYESLIGKLDSEFPGRGIDAFNDSLKDRPMAYALILLSEANRYEMTRNPNALNLLRTCGMWLSNHSDLDRDSISGYGLADKWDAFSDASVNPAGTEYAVTTALACKALLKWHSIDEQMSSTSSIQELVRACLIPYLDSTCQSSTGIPAYSHAPSDAEYDVYNSALLIANEMISFAQIFPDDRLSHSFLEFGKAAADSILGWSLVSAENTRYWNYSKQRARPNDLVHALYMIEGLRPFQKQNMADSVWQAYVNHAFDFVVDDTWYDHSVARYQNESHMARLWSMGLLLTTLSREGLVEMIDKQILEQLLIYEIEPGSYRLTPNDDASFIRVETFLLYGLSEYLFR